MDLGACQTPTGDAIWFAGIAKRWPVAPWFSPAYSAARLLRRFTDCLGICRVVLLATSERVDVSRRNQPQVTTSVASNLWHALVDATQIEVAVLNLAINARGAMPLGGTICIIARNVPAADRPSDLAPGDYVSIEVADTGEGMSEEVLEKAFEPFFTTKELGKGTGLGLSQVYGIARQSGGTARITSKLGVGTRKTVLVIDDQDDVLRHRAVPATDGRLGLELFAASAGSAGPSDVLLVDYAMPGTSGPEVVHAARREHPDVPIVIMTGYADARTRVEPLPPRVGLLKKPFKIQQLSAALESAIVEAAAATSTGNVVLLPSRR